MRKLTDELKNLHEVLTTENDFKPRNLMDFFSVRAHFLVDICEGYFEIEQQNEEMRKALEGLVNLMKLTGQLTPNEEYRNAVKLLQALERMKP